MEMIRDGLFAAAAALTVAEMKATGRTEFSADDLRKMLAKNVAIVDSVQNAFAKRTTSTGHPAWNSLAA